jgi:hypothetical protein
MNEDIRTSVGRLQDATAALDKVLTELDNLVIVSPFSTNYIAGATERLAQAKELLEFAIEAERKGTIELVDPNEVED